MSKTLQTLRKIALKLPDTTEGVACEGTAMERRTIKVRDKAFLFLGVTDALLKLGESLPEARKLAAKEPDRYRAGAGGWVKLMFSESQPPLMDVVGGWIAESHGLLAGAASARAKPKAKKPAGRKSTGKKAAARR
ncbi:MAG: hypothetical protein AB2A00_15500 [Myxococcota bacterium]